MGLAPPSLSGRETCPFRFPSPRGGPLPGSSHPWCLSGSLRRATWGSRRGRVEGGGAPAARVGRAPRSQHCPLPAAGWGPGHQDTVPGLMLPGAGSLGSALCPPLPQWPLIAVSRPQLSPPTRTPVPPSPGPSSLWVLRAHSAKLTPPSSLEEGRGDTARGAHSASTASWGALPGALAEHC